MVQVEKQAQETEQNGEKGRQGKEKQAQQHAEEKECERHCIEKRDNKIAQGNDGVCDDLLEGHRLVAVA